MWRAFLKIAAGVAVFGGGLSASAQTIMPKLVEVDATEFKVTLGDGRVMRSHDLVGARLVIAMGGQAIRVRLDAVERDPDAKNGTVWLHTFSAEMTDGSWQNVCKAGPDGRRQGFPIAGRPRVDGILEPAEPGIFELACTSGALGKCVRFGYPPWGAANGTPLREVYNACIRMVRADYCGDGTPTTRDGQRIDIYDDLGIQQHENEAAMAFEAGWSADGATCVRHTRVKANASLESLVAACPRLKGRIGPACSEETARGFGAKLFNRSAP
jgi:ADYC domain